MADRFDNYEGGEYSCSSCRRLAQSQNPCKIRLLESSREKPQAYHLLLFSHSVELLTWRCRYLPKVGACTFSRKHQIYSHLTHKRTSPHRRLRGVGIAPPAQCSSAPPRRAKPTVLQVVRQVPGHDRASTTW